MPRKKAVPDYALPSSSIPNTASHLMGSPQANRMLPDPLLSPSAFQFAPQPEAGLFAPEMRFSSSSEGTPVSP